MDNFGKGTHLFERLDQANILLTGLKSLIENQNTENTLIQNTNDRLELENKILVKSNIDLLKKIDLVERVLRSKSLKLQWEDSYPVIEKLSEEDTKSEKDTEEISSKHGNTTNFTNGSAEVSKKSDDLSVLKNFEEIDFESLSAQLLQKAIESEGASALTASVSSNRTKLDDSEKLSGQNADINNMLMNMSKNYGKVSPQMNGGNIMDLDDSMENHSDLTDANTLNQSMFSSQIQDSLSNSAQESVHSKVVSSFNNMDDRPSLLQIQQSLTSKSKNFTTSSKLEEYTPTPTKKKKHHNYQCDVCFKYFQCKSHLDKHYRTHSGEKPYECETCGRKFTQKHHLKKHQATHSEVKTHKCQICPNDKYFKTKDQLRSHMQVHFAPKHTCSKCGKEFRSTKALKKHEQKNHAL